MKDIEMYCSFCGKPQSSAKKLIASPNGDAYICDDCVRICLDIVKQDSLKIKKMYSLIMKKREEKF